MGGESPPRYYCYTHLSATQYFPQQPPHQTVLTNIKLISIVFIMAIKNEIKGLIYSQGYTLTDVAEAMGVSAQNLSQKLARGTLRYSDFKRLLGVIGVKMEFKR